MGVEIISTAAIEAQDPGQLMTPAKWIAPITFLLNFLLALLFTFDVFWQDGQLPQGPNSIDRSIPLNSVLMIAVGSLKIKQISNFVAGSLIFAALSAANTALYVASRALFGIARNLDSNSSSLPIRLLSTLATTNDRKVPVHSLIVCLLIFGSWIPSLHLAPSKPQIQYVRSD